MTPRWQVSVRAAAVLGAVAWLMPACPAWGQIVPVPTPTPTVPVVGGVYIDSEGMVRQRQTEAKPDLALLRARAKAAEAGDGPLTYVSLPRLLDHARELVKAGKPLPQDVRCLGGLTRLGYVFVYPNEKDLVIAGWAEQIDAANPLQPVGKASGRPVLQLDDLVVAMRTIEDPRGRAFFGCSIDPTVDLLKTGTEVVAKYGDRSRGELVKRMAEAVGPQKVSVIGTAADTRLAFVMVAADFKLKRMSLGVDASPVAAVGHAVDNSRSAANRFWFESSYEPLLVSAEGDAYAVRGQRLRVECGASLFDRRGATEKAQKFAAAFSSNMPALAATVPLFADLQNVADLGLLAALIRTDRLDRKAGLELGWTLESYPVGKVAVPRTAEAQVNITSGSIACGGVAMKIMPVVAESARQQDVKGGLSALRQRPVEGWLLKAAADK